MLYVFFKNPFLLPAPVTLLYLVLNLVISLHYLLFIIDFCSCQNLAACKNNVLFFFDPNINCPVGSIFIIKNENEICG
jgi:hypothetical protein